MPKRKLSSKDTEAWKNKNERLNEGRELERGMRVQAESGWIGVVVKIPPHNPENPIVEHGIIYVWQEERYEYGADNCEHYAECNWRRHLRILEE